MDRFATISSMESDKDDVVAQQARKNVVCALAAAGLLDHHWN